MINTVINTAFFAVWPYLALAVSVVGHVWRWREDQFGWTTRTSELLEKRWLMWGSPIFHVGLVFLVAGHAMGLVVPASVTTALGVSEETYHIIALSGGLLAGTLVIAGLVILLARRFVTKARLRLVTRRADIVMYVLLVIVASAGMWATVGVNMVTPGGFNYRETVAVWFRSIFLFNPDVAVMTGPGMQWIYQVHAVCAFALIALWPFTRLVHLWSIPLGYITRPLIVYHTPVPAGGKHGR